ncbi:restriction endonuclease subunit S [Candidatus Allofournierella excrementigallinarum]|uniref:restriction endonuclease subunit S n=1 Tax=Candidatus Allofournierella excrementigallinarum TaxID=2838592 RepID=UPI00374FCFA0
MARIDTSGWKPFCFGDLFELNGVKQAKSQQMIPTVEPDGDIPYVPYVVQSRYSNMVSRFVDRQWLIEHDEPPVQGNTLVLGVTLNACSYQPYEFGASQVITARSPHLTFHNGFFMAAVVKKHVAQFDYKEKPGIEKYRSMVIDLPADASGEPDWAYMDKYMSGVMAESEAILESLRQADGEKQALDVSEWREFIIGELFTVVKGTRLTKAHMTPGNTRFIGSSAMNNGCTAMVGNTENMHPANTITVCYNGSVGETFYQDQPFLASDDVNVLYPRFDMTKEMALFVAPLIKSVSARYNYVDKWKQEDMIADTIKLPADASGEPDWAYMDEYMRTVTESAKSDLSAMQAIG